MADIQKVLDALSSDSKELQHLIRISTMNLERDIKCDRISDVVEEHDHCFTSLQKEDDSGTSHFMASCPKGLLYLIVLLIATKPNLIDDEVKKELCSYFKKLDWKIDGLVSVSILELLHTRSQTQTITWLKYEALLTHLIKDYIYEPKTMSNEVLKIVKHELNPSIAAKLSSVLKSCAEICRKINNQHAPDEEVEEKWCEIIEWTSWLISSTGDDNFGDI